MPVFLLHQTPRSWDEYREVLPLVGEHFRAIAMDTRGFGDSDPLPKPSIKGWAEAVLDLADALGIERFVVAGHHTGAVIALEVAARAPKRVTHLVLSAMSFVDAERRARHAGHRVIDEVEPRADGSHLAELWQRRAPHYPQDNRVALLERLMRDALKAGPMMSEGHRVVNRYHMEERIGLVRCPTLVLAPTDDSHAYPSARRVGAAIPGARVQGVPGAMVPFPDQMPDVFARAVCDFLLEHPA
ncbi:alpha/beta fold hydrolase [Tianweitania populi]|uniref:Alpha/beta hydrolase n=1 Tax=Tianweitania populi TaxID=1607949 RepID=A0A8J3GL81_9HYPH|nr:alpha/beta hydrolase [Tianweitania populi]GHD20546.1 alpha/beta hydrolase [Tianweitania populi]